MSNENKIGSAKLDERCVYAIRRLLAINYSHTLISEMFLVSRSTVSLIAENKTWTHVTLTGQELTINL